ncbi:Supporter of activation of yellow protein [Clarias magur]|uniref:Supporter of activation of yellow protein n=1 Tax=Clarias magur TaxID=1594786 RepID=A0A8J4UBF3_CLAMG|nr:Supporter of activation of yellow protein [Clarias magur]
MERGDNLLLRSGCTSPTRLIFSREKRETRIWEKSSEFFLSSLPLHSHARFTNQPKSKATAYGHRAQETCGNGSGHGGSVQGS